MNITHDYLSMELKRIEKREPSDKIHNNMIEQFKKYLTKSNLQITSSLTEVMLKGNHLTIDNKTHQQTNFLNLFQDRFNEQARTSNKPDEYVEREIGEVENTYREYITENTNTFGDLVKPVIEWDRKAVGFYCIKNDLDLNLEELLHYIFVFEYGEERYADSFSLGNALHELSIGVAHALYVAELRRGPKFKAQSKQNKFLQHVETITNKDVMKYFYTPEYEFDTDVKKLAWLHELGITDIILNRTKSDLGYNFRKASLVLESFTSIHNQTIRKCLEAMYYKHTAEPKLYNDGLDKKNNPLRNIKNRDFIAKLKAEFHL